MVSAARPGWGNGAWGTGSEVDDRLASAGGLAHPPFEDRGFEGLRPGAIDVYRNRDLDQVSREERIRS